MATVHPYKGFLNTEFHFFAKGKEDVSFEIFASGKTDEKPINKGSFSPNIPFSLKMSAPGSYIIVFEDGTFSEITVEDGYKFGGSSHKKSFIFDEIPWCFIVMNDRTYFYNRETEESYVEVISPDEIIAISKDYVIFRNNGQEERTIYSLHEQKPVLNISNIVMFNCDVLVWQEAEENGSIRLNIYSLAERIIRKSFIVKEFISDIADNSIIFATEESLYKQNLSLPLTEEKPLEICGRFVTLISPDIIISIKEFSYYIQICLFDTRKCETISRIKTDGTIAAINSAVLIDTKEHIEKIQSFDISSIGCEEACVKATYLSFDFFPTEWDIYYTIGEHIYERDNRESSHKYFYKIKSISSDKEYLFDRNISKVIMREGSICFSNYNESLIFGRDFSPAYSLGINTLIHYKDIILQREGDNFVLDDTIGWKPLNKNCSFRYFDDFGIIKDDEMDNYFDLYGNTFEGLAFVNYYPLKYLTIGRKIILRNGKILPDIKTVTTESGKLGLTYDNEGIYLIITEENNIRRNKILSDIYDNSSYKSVLLSEDGSQIMYRDKKEVVVMDLTSETSDSYDNLSFINDVNGMRPLFSNRLGSLQPRLVDPVTGQTLPFKRLLEYHFVSPNGSLYADTEIDKYIETWNLITNKLMSKEEISEFFEKFSYNLKSDNGKDKENKENRRSYIIANLSYFKKKLFDEIGWQRRSDKELIQSLLFLSYSEFSNYFLEKRGVACIRNKADDSIVDKIQLGDPLWFLNYVSFSYDNRFVAIAGRYHNGSKFAGLFLVYDLEEHKDVIITRNTRAVWLTAFNKHNQVASYSSEPITYDAQLSDIDHHSVHVNSHKGYSFLTFSPDGEYAALSNQGYVSKYDKDGNERKVWGHSPSCEVYIVRSSQMGDTVKVFSDLSDSGIEGMSDAGHSFSKTVASVSFSNDNKRLMMVGNDGVVIIRNLHLD